MSVKNTSNEEHVDEIDSSSVDSFIKELEEKEKDLDISSDLVIEIGESEVEHDNIHDTFTSTIPPATKPPEESLFENLLDNFDQKRVDVDTPASKREIEKLKAERNELRDALARRQRDFDNHRNRTDRERGETYRNLIGNVASQMLPVLDNLNRALEAFSDAEEKEKDFQTFLDGIVLVNQQLNEVLADMGITPIPAVGVVFDPEFHEAVETVQTDEFPERTVIYEVLRGYKVDNKVIRASMVKVASTKSAKKEE